jgi:hypothetical protein
MPGRRWRATPCVLSVMVLLSTRAAAEPADVPASAPAPEPNALVETAPDRRAGWRHEFSPAWHMATFWSKEDSHYTFHSLALSYLMSVNASGPFVHLNFVVPLQARQDGGVHSVSSLYASRGSLDLLLGWQWRTTVAEEVEVEAGPGLHLNILNLVGNPGLANFNGIQIGAGGMGILRWRPGWQPGKVGWSVGAVAATGLDFYDPLRSNDLKIGWVVRLGGLVGLDLP